LAKYRAFISYSHADKTWADWLHRALERYRIPRGPVGVTSAAGTVPSRIAPVFLDRVELAASTGMMCASASALYAWGQRNAAVQAQSRLLIQSAVQHLNDSNVAGAQDTLLEVLTNPRFARRHTPAAISVFQEIRAAVKGEATVLPDHPKFGLC
jgi:hypothetical protein